MGTAIQGYNLRTADFGGPDQEGCNEALTLTRPDVIRSIHEGYLRAGSDIIETNTFGATPLVLAEFALSHQAAEINRSAARLAAETARRFSTPERPRFVAGSMGPTTKALSVTGGVTFRALVETFKIQAAALAEGGADYFLVETCQDTRNIKAALEALDQLADETGLRLPVAVSITIEASGTMLAGQTIEPLVVSLAHRNLLYLGLNCATGPESMTDQIRALARLSPFPVSCAPNAGLPDENGTYQETPESLARTLEHFARNGWLNVVGGCCGTTAPHIESIARAIRQARPHASAPQPGSYLSGIDLLEIAPETRPILVGERTNVIGSRKFKTLITEEKYEEASEIARAQVKSGAQIVDICLSNPDRDELGDMTHFLEMAVRKLRVPLMIDSLDERVIAEALTYCQGKAIINSVNLENGEERFGKILPLARRFGAAVVVGLIDDHPSQGMAVSRARKLEVAERAYPLLTEKYGLAPSDIYWDPLTFPCGTGDVQYRGSALETVEGLRLIKQRFPATKSILGISNVSFGLPPTGRETLNSVFLYHCTQAGLDLAIVNAEKLVRYPGIPAEDRRLCEDLLFNRDPEAVQHFVAAFRQRTPAAPSARPKDLPVSQRLARQVIEGSKDSLAANLDEALTTQQPIEIINGPLMNGMDEVGRLFNTNQLIVAEVLQSAEVMKAAVAHLEPRLNAGPGGKPVSRGRILLATVKGDVHDIGKNLVYMILANNGFEVIDIGIKVPPEQIIAAVRNHQPDIIGLSGLLVKSAHQMVATADDLTRAGITLPLFLGGAALSEAFVSRFIAKAYTGPAIYVADAMQSLELAKQVLDPAQRLRLLEDLRHARQSYPSVPPAAAPMTAPSASDLDDHERPRSVTAADSLPQPRDFDRHVETSASLEEIWRLINPMMLYGRHLGLKGRNHPFAGKNPPGIRVSRRLIDGLLESAASRPARDRDMEPG